MKLFDRRNPINPNAHVGQCIKRCLKLSPKHKSSRENEQTKQEPTSEDDNVLAENKDD